MYFFYVKSPKRKVELFMWKERGKLYVALLNASDGIYVVKEDNYTIMRRWFLTPYQIAKIREDLKKKMEDEKA